MAYTILIPKTARKDIDALDSVIKKRLGKKLLHVASLDDVASIAKKLEGEMVGEYRIRMGDYRVLFDIDKKNLIIVRVQHRKDVYR
ncbi:MAG: type II toxin-antitoxin system RelE/ParE family toxin [Candidatus Kaiserbacteria bacterium]|nr:type II toxin-antitoxin system RelE/ParE family toxin [Candidatus Kaiserbacteria bacterium]